MTAQEIREGFKESDVPDDFQAIIEKLKKIKKKLKKPEKIKKTF